jgi:hypothetical protein
MELQYTGKKVDHPPQGSKDVADGMAGVVTTLMGDHVYRRGVSSIQPSQDTDDSEDLAADGTTGMGTVLPFPGQGLGLQAPVPPSVGGMMGLTVPPRLQPKGRNR